jgi:NAD(P)-dependent dehydrogenase (short-subunit alcohol dehydrogenase family)
MEPMSGRLEDKVCIITGTAGTMGRAAALLFANEGARVVGCDLSEEGAQQTLQEVRATGGVMESLAPVNLTNAAECQALVDFAIERFGRVDVLYNNAAMAYFNWLEDMSEVEWKNTLNEEVNLVFLLTKAAWPHLKANRGAIVNTASVVARSAYRYLPSIAHSTAKAGIVAMTRQLAMEGAPHGIRANSISPGSVVSNQSKVQLADKAWADYLTSRILLGRPGEPKEIAAAALFLASNDSSYVTGHDLAVDGGLAA